MINNDLYSKGLATAAGIGLSSGFNIASELLSQLSESSFCYDHLTQVSLKNEFNVTLRKANPLHYIFRYTADAFKWIALVYKTQAIGHIFFGASAVVPKPIFYSPFVLPLATKGIVWLSEKSGILKTTVVSIDQNHSKVTHIANIVTSLALAPYSIYALKNSSSMLGILAVPLTALLIDIASFNTKNSP